VDWDTTAKTASFTAVSGNGYFVDTTSAAITLTLPSSPSAGDIVAFKDYAFTFETNNLSLDGNGSPIGGVDGTDPVEYSTNGTSKTFIYVDGTKGWLATSESTDTSQESSFVGITATGGTITTCGDYKIHTFTGPGTFCVSGLSPEAPFNTVDYLVVAGGGSGGGAVPGGPVNSSGGGGAGGFRFYHATLPAPSPATPLNNFPSGTAVTVTATSYPITVGAGGSNPGTGRGPNGNPTTFSTITSTAGGAGGQGNSGAGSPVSGNTGGSGGGAGVGYPGTASGGPGNNPPVSPPQGNGGGPASFGGGGGGALAAGTCSSPTSGGVGAGVVGFGAGNGECSSCIQYFAGGGGRGGSGQSGLGGGGCGVAYACRTADIRQGTANTGGGGGGSGYGSGCLGYPGSNGGSGIVVIRYKYQ
jgi:hypothetical protein